MLSPKESENTWADEVGKMKDKSANTTSNSNKLIWIGIGLAAFWWFLESTVHVFVFHEGGLIQQILTPDAHELWMRSVVFVIFILFAIYAQCIINKLKQAEEAMRKAHDELERRVEERTVELVKANEVLHNYERIISRVSDLMSFVDKDYKYQVVNDAYLDAFPDKSREDFVGYTPADFVGEEAFANKIKPNLDQCLNGGIVNYQDEFVFPGKGNRCMDISYYPVLAKDGSVSGVAHISRDITKLKQAAEALRESEQKLAGIVESVTDAMIMLDEQFNIVWANDAAKDLFGSDLIGKKCYAACHGRDKACEPCIPKQCLEDGKVYEFETEMTAADGSQLSFWCTGSVAAWHEDGRPKMAVECLRNITQRKRAEEVLQKSERELWHLSSRLLTAQEEERKRIARELHDGLGQSLCAIQCSLAVALEHMGEEKLSTGVKSLNRSIAILGGVIEELQRISRNLRPSTLDELGLLSTIESACREFESIYSQIHVEKQIDIREDDTPDSLKIVIYRVLQEALNNIAKHSQADIVRLSLKETDGKIELAIYDNGRGFDLEHVLSVEESRRGLGLTGMKERTELSRGSFSIESGKGSGTTVWASWQHQETNAIAL